MIKSYKIEINPNKKQIKLFHKSLGINRFVYNWALNERINAYKENKQSLSYNLQNKELTLLKGKYDWMYEVPKSIHQNALMNLGTAYSRFFKKISGFPIFKSKHKGSNSFNVDNQYCYYTNNGVKINKFGFIKFKEYDYIPVKASHYTKSTISKIADRWFISVGIEYEDALKENSNDIIGIDLGIKTLAMCSDGTIFENPKAFNTYQKKLKKAQRRLAKKQKGSNNRNKQRIKVQKIYKRISDIRKDSIHKMTSFLVKTKPRTIVIEDLNVKGMIKNHKLANSLSDASFGEIKRQLEYKIAWYGGELIFANRFFPSSKLCSNCGCLKEDLTLSDRTYSCDCGLIMDRDLNAAINLVRSARPDFKPVEINTSVFDYNKSTTSMINEAGTRLININQNVPNILLSA